MIRSLYVRITVTFLIIVIISIGVAFLFTSQLFKRDARGQLPGQLDQSIQRIEQLFAVSEPASVQQFLNEMSRLQGLSIIAVSRTNQLVASGERSAEMAGKITFEHLSRVFGGNTVRIGVIEPGSEERPAPPGDGDAGICAR